MTPEELEAALAERALDRAIEKRRAERERALPLPTPPPELPTFKEPETEAEAQAREAEASYEQFAERMPGREPAGAQIERARTAMESARRATETSVEPGQPKAEVEDLSYMLPIFRPTRIRQLPAAEAAAATTVAPNEVEKMTDSQLRTAALATGDDARLKQLTDEMKRRETGAAARLRATPTPELQAGQAPQPPAVEPERLYKDPETGKLRQPTAFEEVVEAFGKQQVLSPAAARAASERIAKTQAELDRRVAKGEDVGWFEFAGPLFSGILSTEAEAGAGTTETELGAVMRSGLGALSALAAEGYFRGLGYEVDASGLPKDPDDFGLAVANLRQQIGVPDVIYPTQMISTAISNVVKPLSPAAAQSVENALMSIPQLAVPTPGVATRGTERGPTSKDPEARRRVSGIEVPSLLEDPKGFVDAEARRIARNLASGRSFADEFLDSPATRKWYENVYGDEDAAFWGGSVADVAMPVGPGTAAKVGGLVSDVVRGSTVAKKAAGAVIGAAEAARVRPGVAARVAESALNLPANLAAVAVPGRASDGRVVRRVAQSVIDRLSVDPLVREQAKRAIKPTSNEAWQVMDDIGPVLDPAYRSPWGGAVSVGKGAEASLRAVREGSFTPELKRFYSQLVRNVPDDLVLITDNVAVPRALARQAREIAMEGRRLASQRPVDDVIDDLTKARTLAQVLGDTATAAALGRAVDSATAAKAKGQTRFLDAATSKEIDAITKAVAPKLNPKLATANSILRGQGRPTFELRSAVSSRNIREIEDALGSTSDLAQRLLRRTPAGRMEIDPAVLDQALNELASREVLRRLPQQARFTRDLTGAQLFLRDAGGFLDSARSMTARRARSIFRRPRAETAASIKIRRDLAAASSAAIKALGRELEEEARFKRSVDEAIDTLFERKVTEPPLEEQWLKALEALYGNPELARAAYSRADAANLVGLNYPPTVASLKAADQAAGVVAGVSMFPDYQKALLKVILEEGVRKDLAKSYKARDLVEAGFDELMTDALTGQPRAIADISAKLREATLAPGQAKTTEVSDFTPNVARVRVYDPLSSQYEKVLADSGEEFAQFAETVEPRMRMPLLEAAKSAVEFLATTGGRNIYLKQKYGYVLPNIPYVAGKVVFPVVMSLVTSGLRGTGEALDQVVRRRFIGGPLYTKDGRVFTPEQLDELADTTGLGLTAVDTERVRSLAYDILKDAELAARQGEGAFKGLLGSMAYEANPLTRAWGQRVAEAAEASLRRGVFEARLADGDTVSQAAEAARRSALDYSQVPGPVRDVLGRFIASAAQNWQLTVELARLAKENPAAARVFYKSAQRKASEQDPYQVQGDRALKSLGLVGIDGKDYYVPGLGTPFAPIEVVIGGVKGANQILARLARASEARDVAQVQKGVMSAVFEGGTELLRDGIDATLPTIIDAIEAYEAGSNEDKYASTDVPRAVPMGDTGTFWAAAAVAHHLDPDRSRGFWDGFVGVFQPEFIIPPADMAAYPGAKDIKRQYWKTRPEGMPYLVWGVDADTGETVYKAMQPSARGEFNIRALRKLPLAEPAQKGLWYYASMADLLAGTEAPLEVVPGEAVPRVSPVEQPESVLKWFLAPAPEPAVERRRQAQVLGAASAAAAPKAE
jgi:hypothetical protein